MFLFSYLKNDVKINKKILEDSGIPLVDENSKFEINEKIIIAKCKTGNFYYGNYMNEKVIIKELDITKDELILNEFIFWNEQKENLFFPHIIGVLIKYNYAYIIFKNEFNITLENRLLLQKKEELSIDNKIKIARQLLNLLNYFENNTIHHNELRSSIISLDSDNNIKILDYGQLIELNSDIEENIKNDINKYSPSKTINENFDIYSFGCILVDLFSLEKNNIQEKNKIINDPNEINNQNNAENHEDKKKIDKVNPLFKSIIQRCIEPDKNKRIKLDELNNNLQLIFDCYYNSNNNENKDKDNINENFLNENNNINEYYNYGKYLMNKINNILDDVNNNLENKIKYLKTDIITQYEKTFQQFDIIAKAIEINLNKFIDSSKKIIDIFYNKILDSTINMQMDTFNNSLNDLYDISNMGNGMLLDIYAFSNFKNHEHYMEIEKYIEKTKNEIEELVLKNSKDSEFDLIYKIYNNKYNNYEKYCNVIKECTQSLRQIQNDLEKYVERNNNKIDKISAIDLNVESLDKNSEYFKSMNENIYAKIKENTNQIYIYNYYTKSISTHEIQNDIIFNSKCYSFFDKEENTIYVSGGIINNDIDVWDDSFFKIDIKFVPKEKDEKIFENNKNKNYYNIYNFGEYQFEITKLNSLLNGRYSHSMIRSIKDRNMIINIGGKNTKSTEVYNLEYNQSANINDLPSLCPNPCCIEYNGCLYLFTNTEFNLNSVYCLDMNKNENFVWTSIQFNMNVGGLKRGMNIININDSFYLFGGYDQSKEFSDIYKVTFNGEYLDINFCGNLVLSHNCSFDSNAICVNKNYKNINNEDENHEIVILIDTMNIVEEIDLVTGKNNYYDLGQ